MTKIVVLNASPHLGGNSATIVDAMIEEARGVPGNDICVHRLDELQAAHGCKACSKCKTKGACVQHDDLSPILEDVRNSDVVIVSTPLYFGHSASQYRVLEDRLYSLFAKNGRSTLTPGKKVAVIVTCGGDTDYAERCSKDIVGVYKSLGFESLGVILFSDHGTKDAAANDAVVCKKARDIGHLICKL